MYLVIVQGVSLLSAPVASQRRLSDFVAGVVTWLGWWRPVWVVPALMALAILVGANHAELADRGLGYVAVGLVGARFIGFGEETMFRGLP